MTGATDSDDWLDETESVEDDDDDDSFLQSISAASYCASAGQPAVCVSSVLHGAICCCLTSWGNILVDNLSFTFGLLGQVSRLVFSYRLTLYQK